MLLTLVWSILLTALNVASAHSTRHHASPLSHYEYLTSHDFDILPRNPSAQDTPSHYLGANRKGGLTHKDAFRLTVNAFNTTFYLHLAPHDHAVHPEAVVVLDGKVEKTLRDRVRVYTGSVFTSASASGTRLVRGRATRNRLLFQHNGLSGQWRSDLNLAGQADSFIHYDFEADARRGSTWKTEFDDEDYGVEEKVGSARIVLHSHSHDSVKDMAATTFEGVFTIDREASTTAYTIKSLSSFMRSKHDDDPILPYPSHAERPTMIIYREDDKRQDPTNSKRDQKETATCGSESLHWNVGGGAELFLQKQSTKRNYMFATLTNPPHGQLKKRELKKRATPGCPTTPKILRMGAAADCSYVTMYGGPEAALQQILTDWSLASKLFERTFNVALSLIRVELRANCDFPAGAASGLKGPGSKTLPTSPEPWNRLCTDPTYTINNRLSDFSKWRGQRSGDGVGLWHLMTRCSTESTVGISWLNMICQTDAFPQGATSIPGGVNKVSTTTVDGNKGNSLVSSDVSNDIVIAMAAQTSKVASSLTAQSGEEFVSGTGVSSITRDEWRVVAHELGHNFGATHDCQASKCSSCPAGNGNLSSACGCCACGNTAQSCDCGGVFLMNPTSDSGPGEFSPCSANTICQKISSPAVSCLVDASAPANSSLPAEVTAQQCGNGIKEAGEECDCGSDQECKAGRNPCCDAQCKLKSGSVCSDSNDTCCNACKPVAAQTVCRPAISSCDIPEVCSGTSGECPADVTVPNGSSCSVDGNNATRTAGMTCASGQCTSRDLQCSFRTLGQSTSECPGFEDSCSLACATGGDACVELQGGFLNGTPCGFGGSCKGITCQNSSLLGAVLDFVQRNLAISLGVGASVLLLFTFAIWRCCKKRRRKGRNP